MFIFLQEVRKYKSCGVFISFVLIFEHCYFVGKIGPDMSTKTFLNYNSPGGGGGGMQKIMCAQHIPKAWSAYLTAKVQGPGPFKLSRV